ncbi:MAG TPA: HEAT repeat domain-containing protein [Spirochaetota bacterium]|nr:HEAT repeat domain-containing protein [Spirochaetota bacterium]
MFFRPKVEKYAISGDKEKLFKLLKHRNYQVRIDSMMALFKLYEKEPESAETMRFMLRDKNPRVRNRAAMLFARLGDVNVIDNLFEIITTGALAEQIEVSRILPHYYKWDNDKITQILALALKDKKVPVQGEAIKTIGEMGIETMAFYLLEFVNHPSIRVRLDTVTSLGLTGNPLGTDELIGALTDSNPEVRRAAEASLRKLGTDKALNALKDAPFMLMVKSMNEGVAKRQDTVINIGKQKRYLGLPLLHKACHDEYKNIRMEAIKSIGLLHDPSSLNVLIEMLNDKYYDIRIEAIKNIMKYKNSTALNALKTAMDDPNTNVKIEAKRGFAKLKSRLDSEN